MTDKAECKGDGHTKLWGWFGMSYASWLTIPRVLMHEMPDEWQGKMADLLQEYDDAFPNQDHLPEPYVTAKVDGRVTKWPGWVLNYRRPDRDQIARCDGKPLNHPR